MASVVHHLVSRGMDHYNEQMRVNERPIQVPTWGLALIGATTVLFLIFSQAVC